ncbi:MAG TPA: M20/M25/M40 family metallo-hydrolase [Acidimicrobiales bacterium]|nr:M20/M25/M40 family metallo-hydrolase [Acidimicrobiales bacterium]
MSFDADAAASHVDKTWGDDIVPVLHDYIRIPNVSVAYDPRWREAGHMARATELLRQWCERHVGEVLTDATVEVHELDERTPLLLVDVPPHGDATTAGDRGDDADTVLLYGHLDKQPEMTGWRDGLGPWTPVIEGDKLYGRGGADDGYATFAAITALEAVRAAGGAHRRCVVLIEASEESGSPDLPAHLEALGDRLGQPSLVVALDSWCGDYDRLWITTSLRGLVDLVVRIDVLTEGVHSGSAGGVVPSSFRILRQLLDRIEDAGSGELLLPQLHAAVPDERLRQIAATAPELGDFAARFPLAEGTRPTVATAEQQLVARTWQPSLEVVGIEGAPPPTEAGNVLRPSTAVKLSVRIPPTADAGVAAEALERRLTADPPYGARVTVRRGTAETGWHAPPELPWLARAIERGSVAAFGQAPRSLGEGGTIPFMGMLGRRFPQAQFVVTGVLGPGSNAHGPNEFLHLPTARKVTTAVAHLLDADAHR